MPASKASIAQDAFAKGTAERFLGNLEAALDHFTLAFEAYPTEQNLLAKASVLDALGRKQEALVAYQQYLGYGPFALERAKVVARIEALTDELAAEQVLFTLTVAPPEASVVVDGTLTLDVVDGTVAVYLPQGTHSLSIEAPEHTTTTTTAELTLGKEASLDVALAPVVVPTEVTIATVPPGGALILDGKPLGAAPWTGALVPGSYALEVAGSDKKVTQSLVVPQEATYGLTVHLTSVAVAKKAVEAPPSDVSLLAAIGWTAIGLGGASLVGGGTFNVVGYLRLTDAEDLDPSSALYDQRFDDKVSEIETNLDLASILYGVGGGLAGLGLVLVTIDALTAPPAPPTSVAPLFGVPSSAGPMAVTTP